MANGKCETCGAELRPLLTSTFCPNEENHGRPVPLDGPRVVAYDPADVRITFQGQPIIGLENFRCVDALVPGEVFGDIPPRPGEDLGIPEPDDEFDCQDEGGLVSYVACWTPFSGESYEDFRERVREDAPDIAELLDDNPFAPPKGDE